MPSKPSLFAQKLKAWRASHGAHGRLTQENLAELLGVSADAIGKYERSVSFIRGDLQHRLADRLGWSRSDILACREDWDMRDPAPGTAPYRIVDQSVVDDRFGGCWERVVDAMITMADAQFASFYTDCPLNREVFGPVYKTYTNQWRAVECNGEIVAKWAVLTLFEEDEAQFYAGHFDENSIRVARICQPLLPGTVFGYSPAVVVCPGHEAASTLLISSFVEHLEELAARDVFYRSIGTVAVSPGGEALCRGLGMKHIGTYALTGPYSMWSVTGAGLGRSLFARRSPYVQARYGAAFPKDPSPCATHQPERAEARHQNNQ